MLAPVRSKDCFQVRDVADPQPAHLIAHHHLVGVENCHHVEAPGLEAAIPGQGLAQVAGTNDGNLPVVGQAKGRGDVAAKVLHFVADAARAVGAHVGQVFAEG